MYFTIGGCGSLFHLMVRNPILVLALGFAGFLSSLGASPHPGDANGTMSALVAAQAAQLRAHPELATKFAMAAEDFAASEFAQKITKEQVQYVLSFTDACTSARVEEVMQNPERRKEAAWIYFLDQRFQNPAGAQKPPPGSRQQLIPPLK